MDLQESLDKKDFVVTSEIQPPVGTELDVLFQDIQKIKGRLDGVTVPDLEVEGIVADTIGTCMLLQDNKFNPILQTSCREKNRLEIQTNLIKASEKGVENILAFTSDYRITGDSLQEMMFFHVDSEKLFSVVDSLKDGHDVSGKEIEKKANFFIGSGIESNWGKNIPDLE